MPLVRMVLVLLLFSLPVLAQGPEPRLTGPISESNRVVLPHSRTPRVLAGQDLGPVAAAMPVPGMTLVFRRSAAQEAALQQLLTAQQTLGSPHYHQWLTPDAFATRFGIADSDIAATQNWLSSHGFHLENVARSRDRITFSGTAAQVEAAFGTALHHYKVDGEVHFAPAADLSLPAQLAAIVGAVLHLSDFRPKPGWKVPASTGGNYTAYPSGAHYLTPQDLAIMYQPSSAVDVNFGDQQLAVAGQSYVNTGSPSPLSTFGAPSVFPVLVPGSGVEAVSLGDEGESEIDLEYSSAITGTNEFFVFVGANQNYSVFDAIAYAITENIAPVVSVSYGACEPALSTTELDQDNALYEEAAAQGQTLVASSGDSGSTACAPFSTADGVTVLEQQELAVNFPASSPYFTAVGGTQMAAGTFAAGNTTYWSPENFALTPNASLLSYVPEVAWNEGSVAHGISAGGGGESSYFPRPAWQNTFPGMPAGSNRLLPDVALQSSIASPGYILCTDDPTIYLAEGQTSSCSNGLQGNGNTVTVAGGTSFAAPIFAGYIALLNRFEGVTGQGNINPILYSLAANANTYAAAFHDITSGSTGCVAGAANCTPSAQLAYAAGPGYDLATGLGSINMGALQTAWPATINPSLQVPVVLVFPSALTAMAGQAVPVQIIVEMNAGEITETAPTGNVSVSVDGTVVDAALALTPGTMYDNNGLASYNLVAPSTSGGHVMSVTYLGDATHSPSAASASVTVGDVLAGGGMTLSAGNLTIANGSKGTTQVMITPTGGYDGRVTWSLGVTGTSTTTLTGCYEIAPVTITSVTTSPLTIGTGAACSAASANFRRGFRIVGRAVARGETPANPGHSPITFVYASLLFGGCLAWRRPKGSVSWLILIFLVPIAGAGLGGCGGGGGGGNSTSTSPPSTSSTFTATLTGTDSVNGLVTATANFTLTVTGQ